MSKVTGFWSLAALVVVGIIIADLVTHPAGTSTGFSTATGLEKNAGNQLLGKAA